MPLHLQGRVFLDRAEAGHELGERLRDALAGHAASADVLVLGLVRGGVPVAAEVARVLEAPLDAFVVRKLGVPGYPELAMGAIGSGGVRVLNDDVIQQLGITRAELDAVTAMEQRELAAREQRFRGARPFPAIRGRTVILVDDGLATGATMQAAVQAIRADHPARVIVAVPVAARQAVRSIAHVADECVVLETPEPFHGVGAWYEDFTQTSDSEVHELLATPIMPRASRLVS